jgi:hypothetical protein
VQEGLFQESHNIFCCHWDISSYTEIAASSFLLLLATLLLLSLAKPNAAPQPRLKAGARHERTLEGVGCSRLLAGHPWSLDLLNIIELPAQVEKLLLRAVEAEITSLP